MWWDLDNMVWREAAIKLQKEIEQGIFKWLDDNLQNLQKEGWVVTKNEQNHFKQMIKVLDEFIEDAGVLHPTQYDRISGVRALLAEMAAGKAEEEEKWYRIYWEEAGAYFAGLMTDGDHPLWTRDPVQGRQYTIDRANEYLGKLKNVEGMMLDIRLVDDGEEEAPPRSGQCIGATNTVKPGDVINGGQGIAMEAKAESGTFVKIDPARKVVTDVIPETKWVVKDNRDGTYFTNRSEQPWTKDINGAFLYARKDDARSVNNNTGYCIIPEYLEVTVKDGKVTPVPARPECGLKEIHKQEYYVIQRCGVFVGPDTAKNGTHALLIKDAVKFNTTLDAFEYAHIYAKELWGKGIWNGKPEVRKYTMTFSEDDKFYTKNEVLSDPIESPGEKPMKYVIELAPGYWIFCDKAWTHTRTGILASHPRKEYASRKDAEDALGLMKAKNRLTHFHDMAKVEAV
jgi:hypothetical protein